MALLALVLGACAEEVDVPRGAPAERRGALSVDTVWEVERTRASLVAALNLLGLGRREEALRHLGEAGRRYEALSPRVRARDPVLDREIAAALGRVEAAARRGDPPRPALARLRAVTGQLTDGALEALVPRAAREDPGLRGEVLSRLAGALAGEYAAALEAAEPAERRLRLQRSYGYLARAGVVARGLGAALGPERPAVVEPLRGIRDRVWPTGIERPPTSPPAASRVARAVERVRAALARRFGLPG